MRIAARAELSSIVIAAALIAFLVLTMRPRVTVCGGTSLPPAVEPVVPAAATPPIVAPSTGECTALDFNADGVADRYEAVPGSCGTGGCVYEAYLVLPGGDQPIGQLAGHCPFEEAHGRCGDHFIIAHWRLGAGDEEITHYDLRGDRLVPYR